MSDPLVWRANPHHNPHITSTPWWTRHPVPVSAISCTDGLSKAIGVPCTPIALTRQPPFCLLVLPTTHSSHFQRPTTV